jgi:hypothetical protein
MAYNTLVKTTVIGSGTTAALAQTALDVAVAALVALSTGPIGGLSGLAIYFAGYTCTGDGVASPNTGYLCTFWLNVTYFTKA